MKSDVLIYIPAETRAAPHLSLQRLMGVPQFMRCILTLADAGARSIMLMAPASERRQIRKAWEHHAKNSNITPHFVWTPNNQRINSGVLNDIAGQSAETVTIINANLLITKSALAPWNNIRLRNGLHLSAVIDRGLPPIIRVTRHDFERISGRFRETAVQMEEIIRELLKATAAHPAGARWNQPALIITPFTKRNEATKFLTEQIRLGTPMWIARNINKRISLPVSTILARLRVNPNTITAVNMLIGLAASIGAAGRTYIGLLIGAILFQAASIIDGCDGEVAKLTHRCTKFGQYIDSISDNFALAGFFTGLMVHIYRVNNHTPMAFVLGAALLIGLFLIFWFMIRFLKKNTDSASFVTFDREYLEKLPESYPAPVLLLIKYGKYTLKKDFFSLLFLVMAIFGVLPLIFYLAIAGVWVGNIVLIYLNLKARPASVSAGNTTRYALAKESGSKE